MSAFRVPSDLLVGEPPTWWWPFENCCLVAERYREIHRDEDLLLHNEQGTSVSYPDGWGVFSYHGILMPPSAIMEPQSITAQTILDERSPIVRGILLGLYGSGTFSKDTSIPLLPLGRYREWASTNESAIGERIAAFRGQGSPAPVYIVRDPGRGNTSPLSNLS